MKKYIFVLFFLLFIPFCLFPQKNVELLNKLLVEAIDEEDIGLVIKYCESGADLKQCVDIWMPLAFETNFLQKGSNLINYFLKEGNYKLCVVLADLYEIFFRNLLEQNSYSENVSDMKINKFYYSQALFDLGYFYHQYYISLQAKTDNDFSNLLNKSEYYLLNSLGIRKELNENSREYLDVLNELSFVYLEQKKFDKLDICSFELLTKANILKIQDVDFYFYNSILYLCLKAKEGLGDFDSAINYSKKNIEYTLQNFGKETDYIMALKNLAYIYETFKKYEEAENQRLKNLEIISEIKGYNSIDYAMELFSLSMLYNIQNKEKEANFYYNKHMEIMEAINI